VLFRQTNVVWVAYVLGCAIVGELPKDLDHSAPPTPGAVVGLVVAMLRHWRVLLLRFWAYLLPLGGFVVFLFQNGGSIVVGDKSHHRLSLHVAQLAYLTALTAGYSAGPFVLSPTVLRRFAAWLLTPWGLVVTGVTAALTDRFTLSHPFLLADNRHYTFYLWARVFRPRPHMNALLSPAYALAAHYVLSGLVDAGGGLRALIWGVAAALVLLPAQLLEPRYFTIPLIVAILEMSPRPLASVVVIAMAAMAVNALTIYVFLCRPFTWGDGSEARFMW
jgi:alpha-1,2-glucosyltransferase